MSEIAPLSRAAALYQRSNPIARLNGHGPAIQRPDDRIELSEGAKYFQRFKELPEVRQNLIDRVKQEIADGSYETPDKFDAAFKAMLEDLAI
jgi:anti-sigma28 factor (negative regulator of flagellin synthesis)